RERVAHCYDGALFAAAALRRLGHPPLLVNMYAERDDEHLLAVFKQAGHWGAVAKSNFVGLRYRDPIYRTLRELVMSSFQDYFNVQGDKTLRGYHANFVAARAHVALPRPPAAATFAWAAEPGRPGHGLAGHHAYDDGQQDRPAAHDAAGRHRGRRVRRARRKLFWQHPSPCLVL